MKFTQKFTHLYIVCSNCGHRNRPHCSLTRSIELVLLQQLGTCKGTKGGRPCGKRLRPPTLTETALVKDVRARLIQSGLLLPDGTVNPDPPQADAMRAAPQP